MFARVARWEGSDAEAMHRTAEAINSQASSGPPDGVPAKGFMMLIDPENGRALRVSLFDSEEDLRQGDQVLSSMSPTSDGLGSRTSVESYEIAIDLRV